ncbi:MAG TPA: Sec-independent protein translocase protein TatB [Geminicoccaceae bacterium]|nr:Sec-independent protein translocase protein TatB [Geminicoccaceae bacterium]
MFDIGWSEMALILLVALVVIGPRDLPRVARTMGRWVAKGRAMAREFQSALEDMAREAELDKVKSEIEKAGHTNLGKAVENTIDPTGELGKAFDPAAVSARKSAKKAAGGTNSANGDATAIQDEADPIKAVEAKPHPPAAAAKPAGAAEPKPEVPAAAGRPRAKAPERETVPADPT